MHSLPTWAHCAPSSTSPPEEAAPGLRAKLPAAELDDNADAAVLFAFALGVARLDESLGRLAPRSCAALVACACAREAAGPFGSAPAAAQASGALPASEARSRSFERRPARGFGIILADDSQRRARRAEAAPYVSLEEMAAKWAKGATLPARGRAHVAHAAE